MRSLLIPLAGVLLLSACGTAGAANGPERRIIAENDAPNVGASVDSDTARVRRATAAYRQLDAAVADGYARSVTQCIQHPRHGVMGYHHGNRALMDARIELEKPEILVYSRTPSGESVLNGVEYVVPFTSLPRTATPPRVMGQALKPSDELQLWYLHVWIWRENPSGLFADWNPSLRC
ncbi:MAG TPA: hypothetical protein VLK84_17760 [Longimicrobium sp.]|nr:hypothetical protein [Longimicrobium sp.]